MSSYLDSGFNDYLQREIMPPTNSLTSIDIDSLFEGIDASKIFSSGPIKSSDGRLAWDLEQNSYVVSDGQGERVRLGKMENGEYGLRIKDQNGNVLMNITGVENILQSSDGKMIIDFIKANIRIFDDHNLRTIVGRKTA